MANGGQGQDRDKLLAASVRRYEASVRAEPNRKEFWDERLLEIANTDHPNPDGTTYTTVEEVIRASILQEQEFVSDSIATARQESVAEAEIGVQARDYQAQVQAALEAQLPEQTHLGAMSRAFLEGGTYGYSDELLDKIPTHIREQLNIPTGDTAILDAMRQKYTEEHPVLSAGSEILGTVAGFLPLSRAATSIPKVQRALGGFSTAQKVAAGGGLGALEYALTESGKAPPGERVEAVGQILPTAAEQLGEARGLLQDTTDAGGAWEATKALPWGPILSAGGGAVAGRFAGPKIARRESPATQLVEQMEAAGGGRSLGKVASDIDLPGAATRTFGDPQSLASKLTFGLLGRPKLTRLSHSGDEIADALEENTRIIGNRYGELDETFSAGWGKSVEDLADKLGVSVDELVDVDTGVPTRLYESIYSANDEIVEILDDPALKKLFSGEVGTATKAGVDQSVISDLTQRLDAIRQGGPSGLLPLDEIREIRKRIRNFKNTEAAARAVPGNSGFRNYNELIEEFDDAVTRLYGGALEEVDGTFARAQQIEDLYAAGRGKSASGSRRSPEFAGRSHIDPHTYGRSSDLELLNPTKMDSALKDIADNPALAASERKAVDAAGEAVEAAEEALEAGVESASRGAVRDANETLRNAKRSLDLRIEENQRAFLDGYYDRIFRQEVLPKDYVSQTDVSGLLDMTKGSLREFMQRFYPDHFVGLEGGVGASRRGAGVRAPSLGPIKLDPVGDIVDIMKSGKVTQPAGGYSPLAPFMKPRG